MPAGGGGAKLTSHTDSQSMKKMNVDVGDNKTGVSRTKNNKVL